MECFQSDLQGRPWAASPMYGHDRSLGSDTSGPEQGRLPSLPFPPSGEHLDIFLLEEQPQRMPGTWVASCSAVRPLKRVTVEPLLCSDLQVPLQRSLPWQAVCH